MYDLSQARIPIEVNINDLPLPPNFENNGKGCNGSYFISRFHTSLSLVENALNEIGVKLELVKTSSSATNYIDGGNF